MGFRYGSSSKESAFNAGDTGDGGSSPQSGRFPWRRKWQPTPVFLPGESHRQRSLSRVEKSQKRVSMHALMIDNANISCYCCLVAKSMSDSFWTPGTVAHYASLSMDSPCKNTGVGCHALLHGIFPIQGLNLYLLHCRRILYHWATNISM